MIKLELSCSSHDQELVFSETVSVRQYLCEFNYQIYMCLSLALTVYISLTYNLKLFIKCTKIYIRYIELDWWRLKIGRSRRSIVYTWSRALNECQLINVSRLSRRSTCHTMSRSWLTFIIRSEYQGYSNESFAWENFDTHVKSIQYCVYNGFWNRHVKQWQNQLWPVS